MSETTENQQPSSGMDSDSSSSSSLSPLPETIPSPKYYRSIYKLPLHRFIDCMVDQDLQALVISGKPTREELEKVWGEIKLEAADKAGDLEYRVYLNLYKEVNTLKGDIDKAHELIALLHDTYVPQFARKLNALLITDFAFDVMNAEEYDRILEVCYNMTGGLQLRLTIQQKNFEAIQKKNEGNAAPTRDYYLSLLITLSDNAGYGLDENITVFEFYERMRRAIQRTKDLKKKNNAR